MFSTASDQQSVEQPMSMVIGAITDSSMLAAQMKNLRFRENSASGERVENGVKSRQNIQVCLSTKILVLELNPLIHENNLFHFSNVPSQKQLTYCQRAASRRRVLPSSWIYNEWNLNCKIVKYCILSEVCMIKTAPQSTVSPQMWCIKSIKGWFTRPQVCI